MEFFELWRPWLPLRTAVEWLMSKCLKDVTTDVDADTNMVDASEIEKKVVEEKEDKEKAEREKNEEQKAADKGDAAKKKEKS
ncbi:hypothetical protein Tco_0795305 [Tanacetum coccineum]